MTSTHQWNNAPGMNHQPQQQPPPYPHQQTSVPQQQVVQHQIPTQGPCAGEVVSQHGNSESSLSPRDWSVPQTNSISPSK